MKAFQEACNKSHFEQAQYWLNGFWESKEPASEYAESVWKIAHLFVEKETGNKVLYGKRAKVPKMGCDLDELQAHRVLEDLGETLTVREMRARLKKLDIDNNKRLSLIEYLVSKYLVEDQKAVETVGNAPQGGVDPKLLAEAESKLTTAQENLDSALDAESEATKALIAAKSASVDAKKKLEQSEKTKADASKARKLQEEVEAKLKVAQDEVAAAVEALEAEEKTIADRIAKLEKRSNNKELGNVKRNSAKNQLAQIKSEDPMPLRKAKITQKAALKKAKKAKKLAQKQTEKTKAAEEEAKKDLEAATAAKANCEEKERESELAKTAAEEAKKVAIEGFAAAEEALENIKKEGTGLPQGKIWWMERVLAEKKKFLPG